MNINYLKNRFGRILFKTNKNSNNSITSRSPDFKGNIYEAPLYHASISLNIKEFELYYSNAGEFKNGSGGIFFYSSPENNDKAISSAHHHANSILLPSIRSEHIPDHIEEYVIYQCKIKPEANVVDLKLPAPVSVVKSVKKALSLYRRFEVTRHNAYRFIEGMLDKSRIAKYHHFGIDDRKL